MISYERFWWSFIFLFLIIILVLFSLAIRISLFFPCHDHEQSSLILLPRKKPGCVLAYNRSSLLFSSLFSCTSRHVPSRLASSALTKSFHRVVWSSNNLSSQAFRARFDWRPVILPIDLFEKSPDRDEEGLWRIASSRLLFNVLNTKLVLLLHWSEQ